MKPGASALLGKVLSQQATTASMRSVADIVEDDADVRACTVETVRELGYDVLEARDGNSALNVVKRTPVRTHRDMSIEETAAADVHAFSRRNSLRGATDHLHRDLERIVASFKLGDLTHY